ncbi:GDP-L-fucose synthase [Paenibacillus chondroitinus]|uniref:GDP-L-fucose synthase n=1 Tax=Paenibacillus chondroitinus TaxID=59842 RepID=A0ABU6DB54_9BACL|nr:MULTISPECIES: GDP-L-fucose synthase [Paenibacillus]MCY9657476.1 GDP-L-fucose synthase [Paenibacillus anseongense]MEB4794904.1 GDP-L-fucose synthase [Paenibacillus chondroitinus]
MNKDSKIYVAGHNGMVGSAIIRKLEMEGYKNIIFKRSSELDLTRQTEVENFFSFEKPDYVFLAAAKVGGIHANNSYPAEFIYSNLMIESNIIHSSYIHKVKKLLFLGSSCIYPKMASQPIKEESLLNGYLEPTNEAYAVAKIAGLKMCEYYNRQFGTEFISAMPTNLYGPNDNYDLQNSHVLPALIRKFHEAKISGVKEVVMWGTGTPKREFLHVDDLADACYFLMLNYKGNETVNVGTGKEISIIELAHLVGDIIGYDGAIVKDITKPDGTPRKLLDVTKLHSLGWEAKIKLREGIESTYTSFLQR